MSDKGAKNIAFAIIILAVAYFVTNRYEVVSGGAGAVIMSKDSWFGTIEICTTKDCYRPR